MESTFLPQLKISVCVQLCSQDRFFYYNYQNEARLNQITNQLALCM